MKTAQKTSMLALAVWLPFAVVVIAAPPAASLGSASKFSSVEYFATPHQQQMRTRVSGAEATPLPDGLIRITQLQIERFGEDGKLEIVINAPDCVYDTMNGTASSPGLVKMQTGDGNFRETGDGFLWRQSESSLTISNNVRSVIEAPSGKISVP
jgi:hypothetical protein